MSLPADVGESPSFQCNICFELPQEPIVALCGHLFCWPCLYKWLHIHSRSPKCPVCKAVVHEDKLVPLYGSGKDRVDPRSKNNTNVPADIPHQSTSMAPQADPNRRPLTRMKRKRQRPEGGDTSTRNTTSDDPPQLEVRNQHTQGACRLIYVVMNTWDTRPVYSLYKVVYPFDHPCSPLPSPLLPLAVLEIEGGRTFVSVQTRRYKWIEVFGGRHSMVFDAETEEVVHEPNLLNAKDRPVLVAVGDKVYALSSFPKVKGQQDFEPWFEVLDLSRARAVDDRLHDCSWEELPSPPCFPCQLAAHEIFHPPVVFVHSYVLVGSYILASFSPPYQHVTYAFDTVSAKWHKVQGSNSLPFVSCPTPQHDGLYLGEFHKDHRSPRAREGHPAVISAYSMKLTSCDKDGDYIKLSVTEFPIKSSEKCNAVTAIHYSSLDKGVFCSLDWKSRKREWRSWDDDILANELHFSKKATIIVKTYRMEDNSLLQEEETLPTVKKKIAISEQPEQAFKIRTKSGGFASPAFLTVFNT